MKKILNRKYFVTIISLITIIAVSIIINYTYSYVVPKVEENNVSQTVLKAKKLGLIFEDKNKVFYKALTPGTHVTKNFDVSSEATERLIYNVKFVNVNNTYQSDVRYTLYKDGEKVIESTPLPKTCDEEYIFTKVNIDPNEKHTYSLEIEYVILEHEVQTFDRYAEFNGTIEIDVERPQKELLFIDDNTTVEETNFMQTFYVKNISAINDEKYNVILNNLSAVRESASLSLAKNNIALVQDMTGINENDVLYLEEDVNIEKGDTNYYSLNIKDILNPGSSEDELPDILVDDGDKDMTPPEVIFIPNGNDSYKKSQSTIINVTDEISGVNSDKLKYAWTKDENEPDFKTSGITFASGANITKNTGTGSYYLWIYAEDNVGNKRVSKSNLFNLDNTVPICNIEVNGTQGNGNWFTSPVTVTNKVAEKGDSKVKVGINTKDTEKYDTDFGNNDLSASIDVTSNTEEKIYYGYIENEAGSKGTCKKSIGVETSIEAPTSSDITSDYDTATINYTAGKALSGIKSSSCYRTDEKGEVISTGTLSGNNCVFSGLANEANTTYYFKKCITSNAGNNICSEVVSKQITGYCTAGNYDKISVRNYCDSSYSSCSNACGGTQYSTRHYEYYNKSKYNNLKCGNNYIEDTPNGCSQACGGTDMIKDTSGSKKIMKDIYWNNGSNPTDITLYITYCTKYNYYSKDRTKICSTKFRSCSGRESGTCVDLNISACDVFNYRNLGLELTTSMPGYFSTATRKDSAKFHLNYFSYCVNGTETGGSYGPCTTNASTGQRYRKDSRGNIHEWYPGDYSS